MRNIFALVAAAAILPRCQTVSASDAMDFGYSGEGEARYADESRSAGALSSSFSIGCLGDQIRYRYSTVELLHGDCTSSPHCRPWSGRESYRTKSPS